MVSSASKLEKFKKDIDAKLEQDFEGYLNSDFFLRKYGKPATDREREMLKDTYLVGTKRALKIIGEQTAVLMRNPREVLKLATERGENDG
jgi:hypothetical protein